MTNRELDGVVAEKIFGWRAGNDPKQPWVKGWFTPDGAWYMGTPSFCDDISAAWLVVEKLREYGFLLESVGDGIHWAVNLMNPPNTNNIRAEIDVIAETAPKAICLAALKACGVEVD